MAGAFLSTLAALLVCLLAWRLSDRVVAPSLSRKVIYFGPACGHVAYTLGFVSTLLDDEAIVSAVRSERAVFGGTSSGAFVAAYASASLRGVRDMRWWYTHGMRRGYEAVEHGSTLAMEGALLNLSRAFHRDAHRLTDGAPWMLPIGATDLLLRPRFLLLSAPDDVTLPRGLESLPVLTPSDAAAELFSQAITASSYVPGLMGLSPWRRVGSSAPLFDGYLGTWSASFPPSYLFVSFLPTLPVGWLATHSLHAHVYDSGNDGLVTKAWPWGDPVWADTTFARGATDAAAHLSEIRATILAFLEHETPSQGS